MFSVVQPEKQPLLHPHNHGNQGILVLVIYTRVVSLNAHYASETIMFFPFFRKRKNECKII
jgi:hypothetical protein